MASKVSVIVPNYCHSRFLKQRLDSILRQDYSDFEVIILDDASTDDSLSILRAYESDPHVKALLVNEQNSGNTFRQWEKGFNLAEGEYIWIAESDDYAEPTLLSRLVTVLETPSSGKDFSANNKENGKAVSLPVMAFAASRWVDEDGQPIARTYTREWRQDFRMEGPAFCARYLLGFNFVSNASAVVFRRSPLAGVDNRFMDFRASGDRLFWMEVARQGQVCYIAEPLNAFRQHLNKVSSRAASKGQNIIEDHEIYGIAQTLIPLTRGQKRLTCGYHSRALRSPALTPDGRKAAAAEWSKEPEFGALSSALYLASRALSKILSIF